MSYETKCPKCGYYSSNSDMCDSCGALISRIKEREYAAEAQQAGQHDRAQGPKSILTGDPGFSWSKFMLGLLILVGVVAFLSKGALEDSTSDFASTVPSVFADTFDSEVVNHKGSPVLVDFYATWCGPCKAMAPNLEEFATVQGPKVKVVKVDVDSNQELAQRYSVQAVPTLLVVKDGNVVERTSGLHSVDQLESLVSSHL